MANNFNFSNGRVKSLAQQQWLPEPGLRLPIDKPIATGLLIAVPLATTTLTTFAPTVIGTTRTISVPLATTTITTFAPTVKNKIVPTITLVASGGGVLNSSPFNTSSFTTTAGKWYIIDVHYGNAGSTVSITATYSKTGITFTEVNSAGSGTATQTVVAYGKAASTNTGTMLISTSSVSSAFAYSYQVWEISDCNSIAPLNTNNATGTTTSLTLGSFLDSKSSTFATIAAVQTSSYPTITEEVGYTGYTSLNYASSGTTRLTTKTQLFEGGDTSPSFTVSGASNQAMIALEITGTNNYIQVPVGGNGTASGYIIDFEFTSTPTTTTGGLSTWTNPGNAILNDSTFATNIVGASGTEDLIFKLSDITSLPSNATITGIRLSAYAKTTSLTNNFYFSFSNNNTSSPVYYGTSGTSTNSVINTVEEVWVGDNSTLFDLTGTQLTGAWWNGSSSSFNLAAYAGGASPTVSVDYAKISIWYEVPTTFGFTTYPPTVSVASTSITIVVPTATTTLSVFAPTTLISDYKLISVPVTTISTTSFAPVALVSNNKLISVPVTTISTASFAPVIVNNNVVQVPTTTITATSFAPVALVSNNKLISVPVTTIIATSFAPVIIDNNVVQVPVTSLTTNPFVPIVVNNNVIQIPITTISTASFAPTVNVNDNKTVSVPVATITATSFIPSISVSDNKFITVPLATIATNAFAPIIAKIIQVPYIAITIKAGGSQNFFINSESSTSLLNATTTNDVIAAPNGTTTADYLIINSGILYNANDATGYILHGQTSETGKQGLTATFSVYAKAGSVITKMMFRNNWTGSSPIFDLSAGTVTQGSGVSTITSVGSGWYRCSCLYTTNGAGNNGISARPYIAGGTANGSDGIYVWGGQVEYQTLTPYIKTGSNSITNLDDNLVVVSNNQVVQVPTATITTSPFAPVVVSNNVVQVPTATITTSSFAPVVVSNNVIQVPTATITTSSFAPVVVSNNYVTVPVASISTTGYSPVIYVSGNKIVNIPVGSAVLITQTPVIIISDSKVVNIPVGEAFISANSPTVIVTTNNWIEVPVGTLVLNGFAPNPLVSQNRFQIQNIRLNRPVKIGDKYVLDGQDVSVSYNVITNTLYLEKQPTRLIIENHQSTLAIEDDELTLIL